jgi:hypothetical protein
MADNGLHSTKVHPPWNGTDSNPNPTETKHTDFTQKNGLNTIGLEGSVLKPLPGNSANCAERRWTVAAELRRGADRLEVAKSAIEGFRESFEKSWIAEVSKRVGERKKTCSIKKVGDWFWKVKYLWNMAVAILERRMSYGRRLILGNVGEFMEGGWYWIVCQPLQNIKDGFE